MSSEPEPQPRIIVDEDWKSKVEAEREQLRRQETEGSAADRTAAGGTTHDQAPTVEPSAAHGAADNRSAADDRSAGAAGRSGDESLQGGRGTPQLPPASLATLVETLAMQAMASLGEAAAPPGDQTSPDGPGPDFQLAMARHLIDTLDVLDQKTRGNRTGAESQQLEQVLHDLRMIFVQVRSQLNQRA